MRQDNTASQGHTVSQGHTEPGPHCEAGPQCKPGPHCAHYVLALHTHTQTQFTRKMGRGGASGRRVGLVKWGVVWREVYGGTTIERILRARQTACRRGGVAARHSSWGNDGVVDPITTSCPHPEEPTRAVTSVMAPPLTTSATNHSSPLALSH